MTAILESPKPKTRRELYLEYMESEHWRELRMRKIRDVGSGCQCCTKKTLHPHVHHIEYRNFFDVTLDDLAVLCAACHDDFHIACKRRRVSYIGIQIAGIQGVVNTYRTIDIAAYDRRQEKIKAKKERRKQRPNRHDKSIKRELKKAIHRVLCDTYPTESIRAAIEILQRMLAQGRPTGEYVAPTPKPAPVKHQPPNPVIVLPSITPTSDTFQMSQALLRCCMTPAGGITNKTLSALGEELPAKTGWFDRIVSRTVSKYDFERAFRGRYNNKLLKQMEQEQSASPNKTANL